MSAVLQSILPEYLFTNCRLQSFFDQTQICLNSSLIRLKFNRKWNWNFLSLVGNAPRVVYQTLTNLKSGEKKTFFNCKAPASFSAECGEFFSPLSPIFFQKETPVHGFEPLTSCISTTSYSTAPSFTYINVFYCEFNISVEISSEKSFSRHSAGSAEKLSLTA